MYRNGVIGTLDIHHICHAFSREHSTGNGTLRFYVSNSDRQCNPYVYDVRSGPAKRLDYQPSQHELLFVDMSNLKAYLAEKYMSGAKADAILAKTAPQKKRRKVKDSTRSIGEGVMIRDEDGGWGDTKREEEEDIAEAVVEKDRGFKKRRVAGPKESNWITIQGGEVKEESPPPAADEEPVVVVDARAVVGGLMNPKELQRILPQNNVVDAANGMTEEEIARAQETVYRDSSGKKIDTKAAKVEAARLKREREELEAKKMEWGKGMVQKDEAEKMRRELKKQERTAFARHADDKEMNEELKSRELWNDPAAAFMTVRRIFLLFITSHRLLEKQKQRPSKTGIYRATTTTEQICHQARV